MIALGCGQISAKYFDALILFALQLDSHGHQVAIDARFMPPDVTKQNRYEVAPFLADNEDFSPEKIILIGAENLSHEVQMILGKMCPGPEVEIFALGHFASRQDEINARNQIAYATGREPGLINLSDGHRPIMLEGMVSPLITKIGLEPAQAPGNASRVLVYIPCKTMETDKTALNALAVVDYSPDVHLHLLTNAKGKDLIRKSQHADLSVFRYAELPPADLLHYFDILVYFGPNVPGERMAALAVAAMGAGKVVVDCTTTKGFAVSGATVLKGPDHPSALPSYLDAVVSRNRFEIGSRIQNSSWVHQLDIAKLEQALGLQRHDVGYSPKTRQTVFFPTNGNGMGHAQRCALIGDALQPDHDRSFVAFPSCVGMLQNRGFSCVPMVPRSADHNKEYAADLVNYLRLRNYLTAADQLVFDGGYVFDSVYRLISTLQIPAIWIRRGLWRPGQINQVALERERAFSKVIVPEEAFAELNTDYSMSDKIRKVGPIVQEKKLDETEIENLRDRLSSQFDREFDTLVVTMLGGGVASERTAQSQLLCSMFERRSKCLHLIIAWPNAVVSNGLYGWQNSHVVHTAHALALSQAADLTISATGYNSFHEILYSQVPAIFIPQFAPYLDDQERRARAASERGLAELIQENELLKLEREVIAFLDEGKADQIRAALLAESLPSPGNRAAAAIIEQEGRHL